MTKLSAFVLAPALAVVAAGCGGDATGPGDTDPGRDPSEVPLPEAEDRYQAGVDIDVTGGTLHGQLDGDLRIFRGVPFAAPPIGELRFRDPAPVAPWDGVRDATAFGPACPQPTSGGLISGEQNEDCLTLNVWAYDDGKKRPVMVFIHGGAFYLGSGSQAMYDGSRLARRGNAVVVTINYRLGLLGFLAHSSLSENGETLGNYGIKDQMAALRWVRDNIEIVGGDPDNVTVFGESAGAISICALMGTPSADALYHKAIIESGVGCAELPLAEVTSGLLAQPGALVAGAEYAEELGCSDDTAACLRAADVDELVAAAGSAVELLVTRNGTPVHPFVDGQLITEQPMARAARGALAAPTLLGTTRDESTIFLSSQTILTHIDMEWAIAALLGDDELAEDVAALYGPLDFPIAKAGYLTFATDALFSCPNRAFADALHESTATYLYEFQRVAPQLLALGSFHALDLAYVFGTFDALGILPSSKDHELEETMQRAWASFAHDGRPSLSVGWPAHEPGGELAILDEPAARESLDRFRDGRCDRLAQIGLVPAP